MDERDASEKSTRGPSRAGALPFPRYQRGEKHAFPMLSAALAGPAFESGGGSFPLFAWNRRQQDAELVGQFVGLKLMLDCVLPGLFAQ